MKKMMIIAAMVGLMLIPAQMEANNKVNNKKPKVEYNSKKESDIKKNDKKFKDDKKKNEKKFKDNKKGYDKKSNKPNKQIVKMQPPRPSQIKVVNEENPVGAIASVIGLAALAAIIAN